MKWQVNDFNVYRLMVDRVEQVEAPDYANGAIRWVSCRYRRGEHILPPHRNVRAGG